VEIQDKLASGSSRLSLADGRRSWSGHSGSARCSGVWTARKDWSWRIARCALEARSSLQSVFCGGQADSQPMSALRPKADPTRTSAKREAGIRLHAAEYHARSPDCGTGSFGDIDCVVGCSFGCLVAGELGRPDCAARRHQFAHQSGPRCRRKTGIRQPPKPAADNEIPPIRAHGCLRPTIR
jgi:hypothetical protein